MQDTVVYLMSGVAHLHYLIPSLVTLRQHWQGDVQVYAFPESFEQVKAIEADDRLQIEAKAFDPVRFKRGKNEQFINKIRLLQSTERNAIYLDADTTVHGDLSPFFDLVTTYGFAATQFNLWVSTGNIIKQRLSRLRQFPRVNQLALETIMRVTHPSVNGGVVGCNSASPVLSLWLDWSMASKSIFICDEMCLHVLQASCPKNEFYVLQGGRYNCSHKFQTDAIQDVVIYHYHGDSNVRPDKSPKAFAYWWPLYQSCIEQNYGGLQEWHKQIPNEWLRKLDSYLLEQGGRLG